MAISTVSDLRDAIRNFSLRGTSDLVMTAAQINNYISLCEAELSRELKIRLLEDTEQYSISAGDTFIDLPDDYVSVESFEHDTDPYDLVFCATRKDMKTRFPSSPGRPQAYVIIGKKIFFNCESAGDYDLTLDYYKKLTALTDSATTNDILETYPDLYLYGSLKQSQLQIGDEKRLTMWGTQYQVVLDRVKDDDRVSRIPAGSQIQPRRKII